MQVPAAGSQTAPVQLQPGNAQCALESISVVQQNNTTAVLAHLGPKKAAAALATAIARGADAADWVERARTEAVVLSAPHSLKSAQSALRAWGDFADRVLGAKGRHLPPTEAGLVAWSRLFRRSGTYANYVGYIALACDIMGVSADATKGRLVRRAKTTLKKLDGPPRVRRFLDGVLTAKLFAATVEHDKPAAMLYLFAYAFMLRVPSEALPAEVGEVGSCDQPLPVGRHSRLGLRAGELVLQLARRKNRLHGSTLVRGCWCRRCAATCPVHVLAPWLALMPEGSKPFGHVSARQARDDLKRRLVEMAVPHANEYWLHDFRRGHTQDLLDRGSNLAEILRAGEWRTPAFLCYLKPREKGGCRSTCRGVGLRL
jgi:hypothetical protein